LDECDEYSKIGMNFKPLKNEIQYESTKKYMKDFEKQIRKIDNEIIFKLHQKEQICYVKNILEAEVQDYEHRERGDY